MVIGNLPEVHDTGDVYALLLCKLEAYENGCRRQRKFYHERSDLSTFVAQLDPLLSPKVQKLHHPSNTHLP